ncbi:hypothetical protein I350_04692 [Cryptococcus amylolentus CBS 6273]|uniref:Uncharacterized protein n=1 Tax=Cryptococcus amylolentus CBS 6273 TaxID=1296118 RepID=A0A1E3JXV0_9TREE|nr:hypothetical protein I350_04692 [Cryptococcus amylolentus CBS 6273]
MPRYIPASLLPTHLRPAVRPLSTTPLVNALRQLPSPTDKLLAIQSQNPEALPPNLRVQEWVDGRARWSGVSQRERLGGKKGSNWAIEKRGRQWGGLKWALRER